MSYILSALKKAEHERHRGDIPDVLTAQREFTEPRSAAGGTMTKPYWIGGVAVLFLAGLVLLKEFYPDNGIVTVYSSVPVQSVQFPDEPGKSLDAVPRSQPATEIYPSGDEFDSLPVAPVQGAPVPAPDFVDDHVVSEETGRGVSYPSSWSYADEIRDIDELPPSLRGQLPRLVLSGHLYSLAHPRARKVILNGVALKEKQYLDDDLMVGEITPDGVILEFQGRLFSMSASSMFR